MAIERVAPDAILSSTNLSGTVADIDEDPDSPDAAWLTASSNNVATDVRTSFPTPSTGTPRVAADAQEFRARVRKSGTSGTGTPLARIELWENGVLVRAGSDVSVTSTTGQVIAFTWNASELATADGSLVECKVVGTQSGGGPSVRAAVDVGAVEWNADTEPAAQNLTAPLLELDVTLPAPTITPGDVSLVAPVLAVDVTLPPPTISQPATTAPFDLEHVRVRRDDGNEAGASWYAALDALSLVWGAGLPLRYRVAIRDTSGAPSGSTSFQLQYRLNGGAWTNVTGASSVVRAVGSPFLADGVSCAQRISSGTFISSNAGFDEVDGVAGSVAYTANAVAELEWCVTLQAADVANGDTLELRAVRSSDGFALASYTVAPSFTVQKASWAGSLAHYRWRNDDGSETAATWKAAEDASASLGLGNVRLRVSLVETGGGQALDTFVQLRYRVNGGTIQDVAAGAAHIRPALSTHFGDNNDTTAQLSGSEPFIPDNNGMTENDAFAGGVADFHGHDRIEIEYCLAPVDGALSNGDTLEFFLTSAKGTITNAVTPTATFSTAAEQTLTAPVLALDVTLPAPTITPGPVTLEAPTLALSVELPAPTVSPGPVELTAPLLVVAVGILPPTITTGDLQLVAPVLELGVELPPPAITPGPVELVAPALVVDVELPAPTITPGPVTLVAPLLAVAVELPTPIVTLEGDTTQHLVAPRLAVGVQLPAPVITPGPVTIGAPVLELAAAVLPPAITPGDVTIVAPTLELAVVLPPPSISEASTLDGGGIRIRAKVSRRVAPSTTIARGISQTVATPRRLAVRVIPGRS